MVFLKQVPSPIHEIMIHETYKTQRNQHKQIAKSINNIDSIIASSKSILLFLVKRLKAEHPEVLKSKVQFQINENEKTQPKLIIYRSRLGFLENKKIFRILKSW